MRWITVVCFESRLTHRRNSRLETRSMSCEKPHSSVVHVPIHFVCELKDGHQGFGVQIDNGEVSPQLHAA